MSGLWHQSDLEINASTDCCDTFVGIAQKGISTVFKVTVALHAWNKLFVFSVSVIMPRETPATVDRFTTRNAVVHVGMLIHYMYVQVLVRSRACGYVREYSSVCGCALWRGSECTFFHKNHTILWRSRSSVRNVHAKVYIYRYKGNAQGFFLMNIVYTYMYLRSSKGDFSNSSEHDKVPQKGL